MIRFAVTGSEGYIGRELVRRLWTDTLVEEIVAFDRDSKDLMDLASITYHTDLSEICTGDLANALGGVDVLFHLAGARTDWGLDYHAYERDNVLVTRRLIDAARMAGITRWVYFGTVSVYGPSETPIDESAPFRPQSDYGRTKAEAETELFAAANAEGWAVRIIRPSAVYSEGHPADTNLCRLIEAIRRHRFVLIGDGSEIKTTSYLHNVLDATIWLYRDLQTGGVEAYNYVDEPRLTTRDMIDLTREELGVRVPLLKLPLGLVERPAKILDWLGGRIGHDFPVTAARIRKFCTATNFVSCRIRDAGFMPNYSSTEALRRTVRWHKQRAVHVAVPRVATPEPVRPTTMKEIKQPPSDHLSF